MEGREERTTAAFPQLHQLTGKGFHKEETHMLAVNGELILSNQDLSSRTRVASNAILAKTRWRTESLREREGKRRVWIEQSTDAQSKMSVVAGQK